MTNSCHDLSYWFIAAGTHQTALIHTTEDLRRYLLNIYCRITHDCVVLTVACSAACSSSVNEGQQSAVYIVINILLLVDTAIKDLDSDLESCSFS